MTNLVTQKKNTDSTSLSVVTMSSNSPWLQRLEDPEQRKEIIEVIKQTVAKNATDVQLFMFLEIAKASGLNPFLKEIWWIPANGGQPMIAEDGWQKICNSDPMYDGYESEFEYADGDKEKRNPLRCTVKIYRKDRSRPSVGVASWAEYGKETRESAAWKYKHVMLENRAFCLSARRAFPVSGGLYTEEELQQAGVVGTPMPQNQTGFYGTSPEPPTPVAKEEPEEADVVDTSPQNTDPPAPQEEPTEDDGAYKKLGGDMREILTNMGYMQKPMQNQIIRAVCHNSKKVVDMKDGLASITKVSGLRKEMVRQKKTEDVFVSEMNAINGKNHPDFFNILTHPEDIDAYTELFE